MRTARLVHGLIVQSLIGLVLASGAAFGQQYLTTTVAGMGGANGYAGDGGPALSAQFANPLCVAVDSQGNYYIADSKNFVIRKVSAGSALISTVPATGPSASRVTAAPRQARRSPLCPRSLSTAAAISTSPTPATRACASSPQTATSTRSPAMARAATEATADVPAANAQLYFPAGLAIDAKGNLYIADYGLGVIRKVSPQGAYDHPFCRRGVVGFGAFPGEGGPALNATLSLPHSLTTDESGNVFVADVEPAASAKSPPTARSTPLYRRSRPRVSPPIPQAISTMPITAESVVKVYPNGSGATIAGSYTAGYVGDYAPAVVPSSTSPPDRRRFFFQYLCGRLRQQRGFASCRCSPRIRFS